MAVNIRGINFHAKPGSRREQVLRMAKRADERHTDWLPMLMVAILLLGVAIGGVVATMWPLA